MQSLRVFFGGSIGGADYGSVRVGIYMGWKMIKSTASSILSQSLPKGDGLNLDDLKDVGVELLEDEASLDYLCNLSPHRYCPLESFPSWSLILYQI